MKPYVRDAEMEETIFSELALGMQQTANYPEEFVGTRDSKRAFEKYFAGELADVWAAHQRGSDAYAEILTATQALIEWLCWIRQNPTEGIRNEDAV